jgi:hypothetical protein
MSTIFLTVLSLIISTLMFGMMSMSMLMRGRHMRAVAVSVRAK